MSKIDDELIETFFQVSRTLKGMTYDFKTAHLTMLQYETLTILKNRGVITVGEIAKYFQIKMPTASTLLNKLIKMKLVKRNIDYKDRRTVKISLSSKGDLLIQNLAKQRKNKIHKILFYLGQNDKKQLLKITQKLIGKTNLII